VSGRRNGVSKIVKTYDGVAKDVETIIRLKDWITDEITEELKTRNESNDALFYSPPEKH